MIGLIKREDALEAIKHSELGQEYDEVEKVPSVDAVPVVTYKVKRAVLKEAAS